MDENARIKTHKLNNLPNISLRDWLVLNFIQSRFLYEQTITYRDRC